MKDFVGTIKWPADKVERRSVASLIPYARNARTHSDAQVAQIAASIKEWGWTTPVLIDETGSIIAGHGRVMAARKLGLKEIPTMVATGWTEAQKKAYVLADNQLALNAGWDNDLLKVELSDLKSEGFDLDLIGFDGDVLAGLLNDPTKGLTDPDEAPELPLEPITQKGDVWILGNHRIICGDSTDVLTVEKVLNGVKPHLMVTDPPYGVKYDPSWRVKAGAASSGAALGKVLNDDRADWREAWALFPGSVAYVWHGGLHAGIVAESLMHCKFSIRAQIVWVKTRAAFSRGHYHWQHEPALYGVKEGEDDQWRFIPEHEVSAYAVKDSQTGAWQGGRKQSTVWFIEHIKSDTGHGTQKPVECMKRPIENNSSPGQAVYEPFSGSGTTIIACEMTGRSCHAIELSPEYVDVAVKRWQNFTGQKAILESNGKTFEENSGERKPS
jgi:DNA modification methylase